MLVTIDADQTWETPRRVYYKVVDDSGVEHSYGPVFTSDPDFDAEKYKTIVASKFVEKGE